jgi:acyl carrier protein
MAVSLELIRRIISLQLGIREFDDGDHFLEDLGAESLDVMNIVAAVEERFGIEIKESEIPNLLTLNALYNHVKTHV